VFPTKNGDPSIADQVVDKAIDAKKLQGPTPTNHPAEREFRKFGVELVKKIYNEKRQQFQTGMRKKWMGKYPSHKLYFHVRWIRLLNIRSSCYFPTHNTDDTENDEKKKEKKSQRGDEDEDNEPCTGGESDMCHVPATFPGTVGLAINEQTKALLHPSYRRYKDISMNSNEFREFKYFLDLLQKTNPRRHRFHQRQYLLISEVFTASDEAFALMVLYNEHHVWKKQREMAKEGKKGNELHLKKEFCNGKSGNKDGWSIEGLGFYQRLVKRR